MKKKNIFLILSIILLVLIDQISKILIFNYLKKINSIIIIPKFLSFTYIKNYGAAFGILEGKRAFFIIITIIALFYLIYELFKYKNNKNYSISLVLIISGIIGNFIDRLFLGYVRDFISFKIFEPVFNIADSFIVIGVMIFTIYCLVGDKDESKRKLDK